MLITFVKSIQVEAYRDDNSTYTTRMDAAYGEFRGAGVHPNDQGMVDFLLYEGILNSRDGTTSRFGLNRLLPDVTKALAGDFGNVARSRTHRNWGSMSPGDKWGALHLWVRQDNIRGYTA